tara:strand:- start:52 stop:336 length:285 start_codon:yes stop_codon:yes gene_type:complete
VLRCTPCVEVAINSHALPILFSPAVDSPHSELASTPVLVLANKIDLKPHISEHDLIRELNLEYCCDNPWLVIPCSALQQVNIDQVVDWLVHQGK